MTVTLVVVSAVVALMVLYWIPVRGWYRRSEAQRLASLRTMSGDTGVLSPEYESTLAITIDALPAEVWPRLLEMGRGPGSQLRPADAADVSPGDVLRYRLAPAFPVHSVDPGRTLVLGDSPGRLHWRWQFELYPVDPSRTRLLSRTRIRSGPTPGAKALALLLRPVTFVLTRKMLFDVKRRAERGAHNGAHAASVAS